MSTLSVRIPDSLHNTLRELSKKDHVSINQLIASAIAEKVTALETEEYINQRGLSGTKEGFMEVLDKVKDLEPDKTDL